MSEQTAPIGYRRFLLPLNALEALFRQASESPEPEKFLFESNARSLCFQLQALSKLYKKAHNKHRFERMRLAFKSLEDQLGKVDFYQAWIREFSGERTLPPPMHAYLKEHFKWEMNALKSQLLKENWLTLRCREMEQELSGADWLSEELDRKVMAEILINEIESIEEDFHAGKLNFDDIETGVHEFRRKIRWISIYAQGLNGLIQLSQDETAAKEFKAFLLPEVINHPFNRLPLPQKNIRPLYLAAPYFYALSSWIADLGKWKDEGLRWVFLETVIRETQPEISTGLRAEVLKYVPSEQRRLKEIKSLARKTSESFLLQHRLLQKMAGDLQASV